MPSTTQVMTILWTLGALAVIARVPQARTIVLGS